MARTSRDPWRVSYHGGHSGEFCNHARGTLDEVVEAAVRAGLVRFGISEHAPRDRSVDLYPDEVEAGLSPADLAARFAAYAREGFDRVQARWGDRIELVRGMEAEVVPPDRFAVSTAGLVAAFGIEYVVGSVHHVHGLPIDLDRAGWDRAAEVSGGPEALVLDYYRLQARMLETVRPAVVGHFDYVKLLAPPDLRRSPSPRILAAIDENLALARDLGALVEVNGRAFAKGLDEPYPSIEILGRARHIGVTVTFGDDSHGPGEVGRDLDRCREAVLAAGYDRIHALVRAGGGVEVQAIAL